MSGKTAIEWTDASWNPVRGCSRVSEGCRHCYAETQAARIIRCDRGRGVPEGEGSYDGLLARTGQWNGEIRTVPELLTKPLEWQRPRQIFVNSMSDLFHERVPTRFIDDVFAVMALARHHTFQVLTKRPQRMHVYLTNQDLNYRISAALGRMLDGDWIWGPGKKWRGRIEHLIEVFLGESLDCSGAFVHHTDPMPLPNVWLGVSAEDQQTYNLRWEWLRKTPAAVRIISAEPLLGDIRLWIPTRIWGEDRCDHCCNGDRCDDRTHLDRQGCPYCFGDGRAIKPDWMIVGGESGPGARPMHPDWARSLRDQCVAAGAAFLFKQHGDWVEYSQVGAHGWERTSNDPLRGRLSGGPLDGHEFATMYPFPGKAGLFYGHVGPCMVRVGKKRAGRHLDGVVWDQYPVKTG